MTSRPKPLIAVSGDSQAEAVALVLRRLEALASTYDVLYIDPSGAPAVAKGDAARCAFWISQSGTLPGRKGLPRQSKAVIFPALHFRLLWPLAAPAPKTARNEGRLGEFPYSDAFIAACVKRELPSEEIMRLFTAPAWNASWPNLDELFKDVTSTLLAADAKSDVKIGSFVLKQFRKQRLFWAVNAPANALLAELTYRITHACFGQKMPADRADVYAVLASIGTQEVMARAALPIHPLVAAHFGLEWYDPLEQYLSPEGEHRTFESYYRGLIDFLHAGS